jgi:uncharacterized protein YbjQ (UPF0145 family)
MPSEILVQLLLPLLLLVATYFTGNAIERRHFAKLRVRENASRRFLTVNFPYVPPDAEIAATDLATGSVVISVDYFKRFLAGLRMFFGGRITSYEPLLDRARREALMRMKENAFRRGFHAVTNVRLETSRIGSSSGNNKGTAAIEILAYGTALKLSRRPLTASLSETIP